MESMVALHSADEFHLRPSDTKFLLLGEYDIYERYHIGVE